MRQPLRDVEPGIAQYLSREEIVAEIERLRERVADLVEELRFSESMRLLAERRLEKVQAVMACEEER